MSGGANQIGAIYSYVMPLSGGYDANGNLLTAVDSVMGQWTYSYDSLNRLTGAQAPVSQPTNISNYFAGIASGWTYDAFGNRKAETQGAISGATPTAAMPSSSSATYNTSNQLIAASQNAGGSLTYDASGNVIYDGINSYLYDAESRLCAVRNTAGGLTGYIYDAAGIRVAKGGLTAFTCNFATNGFAINTSWTLGPGGEQIGEFAVSGATSTWTHSNVFAAGKLLATYNTTGTYFDFTDWLGTKRVEINAALSCESGYRSLPYGNGLTSYAPTALPQCVDATEHHYTGKERDAESGNDYFEARYYASGFGRFMSPDWSAKEEPVPYAKLDDPQSLNLYAYVEDDPSVRVDADGHWPSLSDAVNFVGGALNAYASDIAFGAGRAEQPTSSGTLGAALGDTVAAIHGAIETMAGAGGNIGGLMLDATGPGAAIGVPANVASTAAMVHGATTAGIAVTHLAVSAVGPKKAASAPGVTSGGQSTDEHGNKVGPSGRNQVDQVNSSTKKGAKDAARNAGQAAPVKHTNPTEGGPHYHPTDADGKKKPNSTHYNY